MLQDLHLTASPNGWEAHLGYHVISGPPGYTEVKLVKEVIAQVDGLLDSARAAITEATGRLTRQAHGHHLPTAILKALVWPATASHRAIQIAYAAGLSTLSKDCPAPLRNTLTYALQHPGTVTKGPVSMMQTSLHKEHGQAIMYLVDQDFDRKKKRQMCNTMTQRMYTWVLRSSSELLKRSNSRKAKELWDQGQFTHAQLAAAGHVYVTTHGCHAGMIAHLTTMMGLDPARCLGPQAIPLAAREARRGRDGRTILRWMCGRYPRLGSMTAES